MTIPALRDSTSVYMLTDTLDTAERIARMQHIAEYDVVWVGSNYKFFIRGQGGRTLYVCGGGHSREHFGNMLHHAQTLGWKIAHGIPPARTPS